jgi:hypothetical protein
MPSPSALSNLPPSADPSASPDPSPRPDLNGKRLRNVANKAVYLVDEGTTRLIPNDKTYDNLFVNKDGIIDDPHINLITPGPQITDGAILSLPINSSPLYLIDNGKKRLILSTEATKYYNFNWDKVVKIPQILLDFIPTGPSIPGPSIAA